MKTARMGRPSGYSGIGATGMSGTAINDQKVEVEKDQVMVTGGESGLSLPPPPKNALTIGISSIEFQR
jgi:hypothetical protein